MPRTLLPALLLSSSLIALPAYAAKWIALGSRDDAKIEVDAASKHAPGDGKVRLWHRESYGSPRIPDSGAFSFKQKSVLTEFHCDKRQAATLQQRFIGKDGSELKNESFETLDLVPVTPDGTLELVLNYACRRPKPIAAPEPPPPPPPATEHEPQDAAKKSKTSKKKGDEPPPPPPPPPHWSYSGHSGPEKWGSLGKEYAQCATGKRQSPIDIRRTIKADLAPINFAYQAVPLSIVDNGHSIRIDTQNAGGITVDGERYELVQFHFHAPSEEKVNGKAYAMVAHLVHQAQNGKLAVVAVLMENGKEHGLIRTLWTHLPLEQGKAVARQNLSIDPTLLLPKKRDYYTYLGSLTTPPCTEDVLWLVLKSPIQLSREQLAGFGTVYKNNARPVQATNNRVIKESR